MEYLSFAHDDNQYAVPLSSVRYIAADKSLPVTPVVQNGRKTINTVQFENRVCRLFDMQELLGQASKRDEICQLLQLLHDRERDHLNWLRALENSLRHDTAFTLTRDPCACQFGLWYANFKPADPTLAQLMAKFDQPHRRIHALADELLALSQQDQTDKALAELDYHQRTTLKRLQELFSDARELISGGVRPTVIMLQQASDTVAGLKVDTIGEVFDSSPAQRDQSSDSYMPIFASGWLKNVQLNDGPCSAILVIDPTRLGAAG
ncbi:CZB domain-containing protein [Oceanobacter mangrovi]|uniref:CZB domain-containing protein n=1 Tax=Oceanobacter mangrovi TaxID=2862510 RepID=UPI001C8D73E5|nr:CZB domain-containing protein [Oceanobacter mangrovi]